MSFKSKIEQWILSKSGSYKFYKSQYEKYILHNENLDPTIEEEFNQIKKDFNIFKNTTDKQMETMNYLMKTLFVDYEMNNPKNALKYIQELSNELLKLIDNICKKNDISFWLNYGNLLGAVRHGYFVPWDDEVDIGMMRKDYLEFNNIIKKELEVLELNDIIEVKNKHREINGNNVRGSLQILVKNENLLNQGSDLTLAVLNIFPYDFINEENKKIIRKEYRKFKSNFLNNESVETTLESDIEDYYSALNLSLDDTTYIVPGVDGLYSNKKVCILESDKIFPLKTITFGDNSFHCPNDVHYYLKVIYKDYLNLPRIISIHENVDKFRYNHDIENIFNESFLRLSKVNGDF